MEHAEAHEWLEDLALEPRRLARIEDEVGPEATAFRLHLAACPACRADLDAWRRTHDAVIGTGRLGADMPGDGLRIDEAEPTPPSWLRERVAAIPARIETPTPGAPGDSKAMRPATADRWRRPGRGAWPRVLVAGLAAALVIGLGALAGGGFLLADGSQRQATQLAGLGASMTRVLADPGHRLVTLTGLDGVPAGTAAWSTSEIVLASTTLPPPSPGMEYRCWIERDGSRTPIGVMTVDDSLAYWSGPLGAYHGLRLDGGGVLGVSLEPVGGPGGHAPLIAGSLPG